MPQGPTASRFEFVTVAGKRAHQLLRGALPRAEGVKPAVIARREVLRGDVRKLEGDDESPAAAPDPVTPGAE